MRFYNIRFPYVGSIESLPTKAGVYVVVNDINNYVYIGKSKNIRGRARIELNSLKSHNKKNFNNKKIQKDFDKYGEEHFSWYYLCLCKDDEAIFLEDYYIKKFESIEYGYNHRNGDIKKIQNVKDVEAKATSKIGHEINNIMSTLLINVFDKKLLYLIKYNDFKKSISNMIYPDINKEVLLKIIKENYLRVFVKSKLCGLLYEITIYQFEIFLDSGNISNMLINDYSDITIDDIYMSAYNFKKDDRVKKYVEDYNESTSKLEKKYKNDIDVKTKQYETISKECEKAKQYYIDDEYYYKVHNLRIVLKKEIEETVLKLKELQFIKESNIGITYGNYFENLDDKIIRYHGLTRG